MKKKLLTVLVMSVMVLAGSTVARAEDMPEVNPEEISEVNTEDMMDTPENDEDSLPVLHSGDIAISEDNFPDENFRKYLENRFDKDWDGYFSQDEINDITSIELFDGNPAIKSLDGIRYFTNLTSLTCKGMGLTSLDVSGNLNLQSLSCSSNQLTALDVSKTPKLQSLECQDNQLTELNISVNPNLQTLNCLGNQLTDLDISKNLNLQILRCHNNQLIALDVSQNPNITILDCSYNKILKLDVSNNSVLSNLCCNNNQLTTLDVSGNLNLTNLDCYNNKIQLLDVSNNSALSSLWCSGNQLTTLDISKNSHLTELHSGSNHLTTLDVSKNPNLTNLECSYNQISTLDVSNNPNLTVLHCNGNKIKSLDVSNNLVLSILGCTENQLTELNVSNNSELSELSCASNQLAVLDVSQSPNLKTLYCINNQLTELDVSKNTSLIELRCKYNHLTNLDLSCNKNMRIRGDGPGVVFKGGAHVIPQGITTNIAATNGKWTLNLADIVGKENLSRITLATTGATLSADGIVTFSGSNMPTELVYNYDTKNPAENTPMAVNVALKQENIDDQTGKDVTVDTGEVDIENICKENNININANFEIILSQGTPSKEDLEKLTQEAGKHGYSIAATYEILMTLYSNRQKVADITDNFGKIKLTFKVNASLAGQNAVVYQLHNNSQVITHNGLTVNTDGTVTITVDKFSAFVVAVQKSSGNTSKPNVNQTGTNNTDKTDVNKPNTSNPDVNKPDASNPDTKQPDGDKADTNQSNTNQFSPKTGDNVNLAFWMIAAIAAFTAGVMSRRRGK